MPKRELRRSGNSVGLPIPHQLVLDLQSALGEPLIVKIEATPTYLSLGRSLKGKITADEFTTLSNDGEGPA
jgi:antitoxin component of MazEF toxin-antitoxin module